MQTWLRSIRGLISLQTSENLFEPRLMLHCDCWHVNRAFVEEISWLCACVRARACDAFLCRLSRSGVRVTLPVSQARPHIGKPLSNGNAATRTHSPDFSWELKSASRTHTCAQTHRRHFLLSVAVVLCAVKAHLLAIHQPHFLSSFWPSSSSYTASPARLKHILVNDTDSHTNNKLTL